MKQGRPFRLVGAAALGGAMLIVTDAAGFHAASAGVANPGMMNPSPAPPPGPDEDRHRSPSPDSEDELDDLMDRDCRIVRNWNQNRCSNSVEHDDPSGSIVAPPTGSEGSSAVLPDIPTMNRNENRNRNDQDIGEDDDFTNTNTNEVQNCIGYECSQATEEQEDVVSGPPPPPGDPAEITGYFTDEYLRTGTPPATGAGDAAASKTQDIRIDRPNADPAEITGYFTDEYLRTGVSPDAGNDEDADIPVNLELRPVAIEPGNAGEPPPEPDEQAHDVAADPGTT